MHESYYDMIFKRKSFHMFREIIPLTPEELNEINDHLKTLIPLNKDIKVSFKIVPKKYTTSKRGEYCILIYSETKDNFVQNVGYMGEQLDLWLASKDIGVCWYGLAKPNEMKCDGLDFIIMLAIGKSPTKFFRKDYRKCARRPLEDIWNLEGSQALIDVVRYAPSACNSQPWFIENKHNTIKLYRTRGKKGIISADKMPLINRVDIGIMILFLDVYLNHHNIKFTRDLFPDYPYENEKAIPINDKVLSAVYTLE